LAIGVVLTPAKQSFKQVADTPSVTTETNDTTAQGCRYGYNRYGDNNADVHCNTDPVYIPPIQLISYPSPYPGYNGNGQIGNVAGISGQIVSTQQQIGNQMQNCVNNARSGANQIIGMKNQQKQMQAQIDSLNDQIWKIDTSTPGGQRRHDAMDTQIQQMQKNLDNYNDSISKTQDQYNTNNDHCKQNVDNWMQVREDQEGKLNDAFNQSMDIQIPY
jgi:hypothetical protein